MYAKGCILVCSRVRGVPSNTLASCCFSRPSATRPSIRLRRSRTRLDAVVCGMGGESHQERCLDCSLFAAPIARNRVALPSAQPVYYTGCIKNTDRTDNDDVQSGTLYRAAGRAGGATFY